MVVLDIYTRFVVLCVYSYAGDCITKVPNLWLEECENSVEIKIFSLDLNYIQSILHLFDNYSVNVGSKVSKWKLKTPFIF